MFSTICKPGARIEDIEEEIKQLEDREDRHLVVVTGTNNIQMGRSEELMNKYKKLIDTCKNKRNRAITIVGIPSRYDLTNVQNSRRIGVNQRVQRLCEASGIKFMEYECGRSRIAKDKLHLNNWGQDELARMIFLHCEPF